MNSEEAKILMFIFARQILKMKSNFLFLLFFIGSFVFVQAQNEHISGYNMTSFTYKHDKKWSAYLELQDRSLEKFELPDYYEIKGGIGYNIVKNNQIFIGIGKYGTYKDRKFYQREFRLWLQYVFSHNVEKVKLDHRFRAEKRFFYYPQSDQNKNDERFRYRLSATLPLNNEKMQTGTFFINAFDEIFVGPAEPTFKRNRIFGGFGYQLNDYITSNLGYMWQREFSASGNKNYHFLYFGINFTFDRMKHYESDFVPVAD